MYARPGVRGVVAHLLGKKASRGGLIADDVPVEDDLVIFGARKNRSSPPRLRPKDPLLIALTTSGSRKRLGGSFALNPGLPHR